MKRPKTYLAAPHSSNMIKPERAMTDTVRTVGTWA